MAQETDVLRSVRRTVKRLAADADDQILWLTELRVEPSADELALEFDDVYRLLAPRADQLELPPDVASDLVRLDALLSEMSGPTNSNLWDFAALSTSPRWADVRRVAARLDQRFSPQI